MNEKKEPILNAMVVLVPETQLRAQTQLFKNVTSDASGRFRIQTIAPGSYKLFTWEEAENGAWLNSDFMRIHEERGTAVQVREGETQTISVLGIVN
jgi:uncharacterized surface anchored protein